MATLTRLRDFTNDRDSVPPVPISAEGFDSEFDQLITESNAQNIRIGTNETRLTTLETPGSVTPAKISFIDDTLVATDTHIMVGDGTDFGNVAVSGDATLANTGALTISNDAITTAKVLDANVTLAKLQNATATNKILGRVSTGTGSYEEVDLQTSLTSTDEAIPTSKAVRDDIVSLVNDVGGFVAVADDQSFPNANPDPDDGAGTVVSIANAGGLVVDGSGGTTTAKTLGGSTVTINSIPSEFYSSTIGDGLGMQVITTSTLNTYTFHRMTAKEVDISAVATNIGNVNNVGNNITNVGLIAGQISPTNNISTLGNINSDITTVSGIASDVSTVSSANANIQTCANNISGINSFSERYRVGSTDPTTSLDTGDLFFNTTTNQFKAYGNSGWQKTTTDATDQANINTTATNIASINTVSGISSDVTVVANDATDIGNVSSSIGNVNIVGDDLSGQFSHIDDAGSITSAVTSSSGTSNVQVVATNIANVNTVAGISSNVTSVAGIASDVTAVANDATDIGNVSSGIGNVNIVGDDLSGQFSHIDDGGSITDGVTSSSGTSNVQTVATNIANVNTVAGSIADVNRYANEYTIASSAPSSPSEGDLWYDESNNVLKVHNSSSFVAVTSATAGIMNVVDDTTPQLGGNLDMNGNNVGGVTPTEMGYVSGVTSSIQTQLNAKQATVANVSDTEIGYLDGVTSSIQTQINNIDTDLSNDSSPQLAAALDCQNNNITNSGTISGANLQIDFGGLT